MPAASKAQQALFAIAEHEPGKLNAENRKLAALSKKTLRDFAATKRKGLPRHARKANGRKAKRGGGR